jgi:hypothetical protein
VYRGNRSTGAVMDWSLGAFGDLRLDKGGAAILEQMVARKTVCLKRLGGDRKGEERVGRFFASERVTAAKIIEGWSALTGAACAGRHVLAIDDTTERLKMYWLSRRRCKPRAGGTGAALGSVMRDC